MTDRKSVTATNLIGAGLAPDLANIAVERGYTLTKLKNASKKDLLLTFSEEETEKLIAAGKRPPIPEDVVSRLISECDWQCCICWNYYLRQPVIIHHIVERSKTQDDSYDNLVVLCSKHHDLAHTKSSLARPPLPPEVLKNKKAEWIEALTNFRLGFGPVPTTDSK